MSISAIEPLGFTAASIPQVSTADVNSVGATNAPTRSSATSSVNGTEFAQMLTDSIDQLQAVQTNADQLSVKAATGDLDAMHDYTIAATEASVTTQLTVAVRNKAVEAFQEIMRMQA
ncbi:flagellar hook-basal body complex protein FliE [Nocardioides yefusunii]|uniref:Flagellar hook-basal body complex protein FliE n=1 Tax=Nocardioides yefusunii TaxID=2500546 RepID=A0ABW1R0K8_9ACTN|nr:flagellar hook-basal body complex protein FliE [Nocardioides yefusunii]